MSSQSVRPPRAAQTARRVADPAYADARIGFVRDDEEADAVCALRRCVLAHAECDSPVGADSEPRDLVALDDATRVWYARDGAAIVGTIAQTMITAEFDLARLPAALALEVFPRAVATPVGFSSRFAIAPGHRGMWVLPSIARCTYAYGRERGAKFDVMATNPGLVPMFERLGYVRYTASAIHEDDAATLIPMVLPATDYDHLRRVRSACLPATAPFPEESWWGDWLRDAHPIIDAYYGPDAATESHGATLARHADLPTHVAVEASAMGYVHYFAAGTRLLRAGDRVTCAFVALDGRLRVGRATDARVPRATHAPDGVAFAHAAIRCESASAVLCIPATAIARLQHRYPQYASTLQALLAPLATFDDRAGADRRRVARA